MEDINWREIGDGRYFDLIPLGHNCGSRGLFSEQQFGDPSPPPFNHEMLDRILEVISSCYSDEDQGRGVSSRANPQKLRGTLWLGLLGEFRKLCCTKDREYADLRKKLTAFKKESSLIVVSTISVAMANKLGVFSGVIVSLCSILVIGALQMSAAVFCSFLAREIELETKSSTQDKKKR